MRSTFQHYFPLLLLRLNDVILRHSPPLLQRLQGSFLLTSQRIVYEPLLPLGDVEPVNDGQFVGLELEIFLFLPMESIVNYGLIENIESL